MDLKTKRCPQIFVFVEAEFIKYMEPLCSQKTNARFVFPANRDGSLGVRGVKVPRGALRVLWPFQRFCSGRHSGCHRSFRPPTVLIRRADF